MVQQVYIRCDDKAADEEAIVGGGNVLASGNTVIVYYNDSPPRDRAVAAFDRAVEIARKLHQETD